MNTKNKFNSTLYYTYVNEDQIDVELLCIICNEPYQSPVNCLRCGQTLCERCYYTWEKQHLTCPFCRQAGSLYVPVITRIVLNQLNRLNVQCILCQQTNIKRGNFFDHITYSCPKQIIICTGKCGWKGHREKLENHLIRCRQKSHWFGFLRKWNFSACTRPTTSS
ncbi:unnamed protein product [Rotaria magnacalcarata]|uniref:RING-type domain-containing protein n=1 Tax=Rotaria magnacalcarata TaxID=392030 RepID=A0A818Z333_9BILA|nr:unnamed protein product [Rotaria magnacalcarata]CAF1501009.1 unnamed protein product [Rotaria magnacalcarata]CAF2066775.1 unnamed protein product [Rotaria magnacalcarata]CAF2105241.1 unnamed protein product [Rotaria magnacalcarata]CAF2158210.1 unnamed protein product [Rotaria magnacalcarata]